MAPGRCAAAGLALQYGRRYYCRYRRTCPVGVPAAAVGAGAVRMAPWDVGDVDASAILLAYSGRRVPCTSPAGALAANF